MLDYESVRWGRKAQNELGPLLERPATDLHKLATLLQELAALKAEDVTPTEAQMTVLLQYLHVRNLDSLKASKGGLMVELSGGGYEYERFLLREDGRMPNHKYESRKASA